ncbi:hypothetical protein AB0K93_11860 [Streptomyces sp. NPDC052676]|uniref:hypothetical protein n=1 Tax=Streptomyces sp. NPDC052676 TaxID=3154953 RepID=UPI003439869E
MAVLPEKVAEPTADTLPDAPSAAHPSPPSGPRPRRLLPVSLALRVRRVLLAASTPRPPRRRSLPEALAHPARRIPPAPRSLHAPSLLRAALALRPPRPLPAALALILAVPLLAVAHQARPAPYGDRLTVHARVEHGGAAPKPRIHRAAVEGLDPRTGALHWRHTRDGRRPLAVVPARGEAITLWDDGIVTDTDGRRVRWHRALPAAADWLRARGGSGVLRPLGRGMLAVVTPRRVMAYRLADGDLRWVLPARQDCAFAPARAVRHSGALLLAQPCGPSAAWTAQLIAVDDLGRITPRRRPLGNGLPGALPGGRSEHPNAEKVVASPR